ncbi:MAG: amidohydrolase, partial [Clostridia bacterium]|nr:amidohydrolase [Clostridia bacterium]
DAADHNGHNPVRIYGESFSDIDEYVAFVRRCILEWKARGAVALKSALAYDRGLDFHETTKEKAQRVFRPGAGAEDIRAFQDYLFFAICRIAAEQGLPFQNHTGLGVLERTNAMRMREAIEKNPDTKFVLFHGSYPWMDDLCGLLHNCPNVYPDLCWLPLISTSAAKTLLHQLIELGRSDCLCWGCDTRTGEESYGALLAMRSVMSETLGEKVDSGYCSADDALRVARNILRENPKGLYGL